MNDRSLAGWARIIERSRRQANGEEVNEMAKNQLTVAQQALKATIAREVKYAATGALIRALEADYTVEKVDEGNLYVQYRVRPRAGGAPRYFLFKLTEPI